ncbi:hypothetical protein OG320_04255 [Microbispora sp. NBC_01189]|uniref:hypothetical protein n=1 Tax=Microbispora sp. NBC_01189 TaxID=2903583 RepID=UPI002E147A8F|nr:hypothetical protein OG320_04255 [Microbispora sp. NBC_01189]
MLPALTDKTIRRETTSSNAVPAPLPCNSLVRKSSVALAEELAVILREHGIGVQLAHRDVTKPIIQRTG